MNRKEGKKKLPPWFDEVALSYHYDAEYAEEESEKQECEIWRRLKQDEQFIVATHRIQASMAEIFKIEPEALKLFFRYFGILGLSRVRKLEDFVRLLPEKVRSNAKRTFNSYAKYVDRFRVHFKLRIKNSKPNFKLVLLPSEGVALSGRITDRGGIEMKALSFEDSPSTVPAEAIALTRSKDIKYVELHDDAGSSILTRLEIDSYHPNGVTIVSHHALQPYLWCLVGEDTTDPKWRQVYKAVSALQRSRYGRSKAGRKRDSKRMQTVVALLDQPGSKKSKAAQLDEEPPANSTNP
jgi:hypothetical protein